MNIQAVGNWLSDCVDSFYCPKRAGVKFTSRYTLHTLYTLYTLGCVGLNYYEPGNGW